jgi:ribosomal protein S18 acetylase RimI-like enzyme
MAIFIDTEAVLPVTLEERQAVLSTLLLAFSGDPVLRWIFPDTANFLASFPELAEAFGGAAFEHGTAHAVGHTAGAALWLPPGVHPDEERLIRIARRGVSEDRQPDIFALMEQMEVHRPDGPHWHLPLMGVEPMHQGRGLGSTLLGQMNARLDAEGSSAYLQATSEGSRRLYERHDFKVVGEIRVADSPPMYPMLRRPC